jgi:outer membrane biogenesis lipoprotein LolB
MKKLLLIAVVFLSGCANFDADKFAEGMRRSSQQSQQNQQIIQSMQPYTIQQPQMQQQKPMVIAGFLQQSTDNGQVRYCKYSNGIITTIALVSLCPLNNP